MTERPSIPHRIHRVPTGPRRHVQPAQPIAQDPHVQDEPAEQDEPAAHDDPDLPQGPLEGWSVESFMATMRKISDEAVMRTRQDDKLRVDTSVGLIDSKIDGAITRIVKADRSGTKKWKTLATLGISAAGGMGIMMATCMNAYQDARFDVVVPTARAEAKVETLEDRMADSERRHEETDKALGDIKKSLEANTDAVLGIAKLLDPERDALDEPAPAASPAVRSNSAARGRNNLPRPPKP